MAPLLPMLIALIAAAVEIELGQTLDSAAVLMLLVLIMLVLARQALLLRDLSGPGRGAQAGAAVSLDAAAALGGALAAGGGL